MKTLLTFFLLTLCLPLVSWSQGFTISGNQLRDANGNNFIMKGVNVPLAWFISDVNNNIGNIRNNTNSNTLRIVVSTSTSNNDWQTAVERCIANDMIPMVELHSVTGSNNPADLQRMAEWWADRAAFLTRPDIARYILINIANEWGDWYMSSPGNSPSQTVWRDAYINAVQTIRNAGINTTLVVDAPGYGQDNRATTLLNYADDVQNADPRHNILFSVHMYCEWRVGGSSSINTLLPQIKNSGIPIIVGEFGFQHASDGSCDVDEQLILNTAQANGIGWLAWSWKGNGPSVSYLDLSYDWSGSNLTAWGNTVVWGTNGTQTSQTASVFGGSSSPCGTDSNGYPICCNASSDPDGDGWGWENNQSCVVQGGGNGGDLANGTYIITARHSGKALDVYGWSTANGGNIAQWTNNGADVQKWEINSIGEGYYSIISTFSGKALDVSGWSTSNGGNIQQWDYVGGANQQWEINDLANGYYRIVNRNSGLSVDIAGASTADGANVLQWTSSGGTNQQFSFIPTNSTSSTAIELASTARITLEEEPTDKIGRLLVYPNPSSSSFTLEGTGSFTYTVNDLSGKTLDKGKGADKANIGHNLPAGIYMLHIIFQQGSRQLKLIKQ